MVKIDFRLAVIQDLPQIKTMYQEIIKRMDENQIQIWDDVYPCEFFEEDIKKRRLYLMLNNDEIISSFVLCDSHSGENAVKWEDDQGRALYLDRLGVNTGYLRKG